MKKSHLLWKILVVVMIVSAMMATFVACGHDCAKDGHIDENGDYWCDACGAAIQHQHADANRDRKCDLCGADVDPCGLGNHVDADNNHRCDECTRIFGAEEGWNNFFADLDKVIDSMGTMGDLATMGGNVTANISFDQAAYTDKKGNKTEASSHDIEVKVDFGLDLATEFDDTLAASGSENAFGVTITDTVGATTTTLLGLWYVDNGSAKENYILAKFGEEVFKISAPSLAETFATYPIDVNVNITDKVNEVGAIDASSVTSIVAGILPLDVKSTATSTTYSIALTDYLFNEVTPPMTDAAYGIGGLLSQGLSTIPAITKVLNAIGLGSDLLSTLNALLPGLTLDVTFNKDAAGNTTGAAIGIGIAGEAMSVELYHPESGKTDGLIYDIFKTEADADNGTIIINDGFGDITLDVALSYKFGSNAEQAGFPYSTAVKEAFDKANTDYGAEAREIGLLNAAIDGKVLLGLDKNKPATYDVKLAIDLNPSALTKNGLMTKAYVINDAGQGIKDSQGNPKMVDAINLDSGQTVTAYEIVLSAIDNLYIKLGDLEVRMTDKDVAANGTVPTFEVNISGLTWIQDLLKDFGVDLSGVKELFDNLKEGEMNIGSSNSLLRGIVLRLLSGLVVKGFSYQEPASYVTETTSGGETGGETGGDSSDGGSFDISKIGPILEDVVRYIEMFKFNRVDKDTLTLTVNEKDMNGAGVSFDATAKVTRDTDDTLESLTLSLGTAGLVINGSDDVDTTLKMVDGWPLLKIGGEGNLFKAAINAVVKDERDIKEGTDAEGIKFYYLDKNGNGKYDEPVKNDKGELVGDEIIDAATAKSKDMNLTIGLNLKGIGYGVVPKVGVTQITEANFGSLFSNPNLAISANSTTATE